MHGLSTKWSPAAYLEAAVALSFVLDEGCGQLRRLWYRSTGRECLEKVFKGACVVMSFMNPLKSILIEKMKKESRTLKSTHDCLFTLVFNSLTAVINFAPRAT